MAYTNPGPARAETYAADVEHARQGTLASWLRSRAGDHVIDDAVLGCWHQHEAESLLLDFDLDDSRENLRWLAREIDRVACEA